MAAVAPECYSAFRPTAAVPLTADVSYIVSRCSKVDSSNSMRLPRVGRIDTYVHIRKLDNMTVRIWSEQLATRNLDIHFRIQQTGTTDNVGIAQNLVGLVTVDVLVVGAHIAQAGIVSEGFDGYDDPLVHFVREFHNNSPFLCG